MDFRIKIAILFVLLIVAFRATGQSNSASHNMKINIPEVALLALVSDNNNENKFNLNSPTEAGNPVNFVDISIQNNIWINYSSINRNENHSRRITAVVQGEIPEGVEIMVEATEAQGNGKGKLGSSAGMVKLSERPTEVITNIASCYTGKGTNNGHQLTYKLEFNNTGENYAQLLESTKSVNIVYTFADSF